MQHPDPTLLARRVALRVAPDKRFHVVYRSNHLNPRASWGLTVPTLHSTYTADLSNPDETTYSNPILIFDNYHVPLICYLPALQVTIQHPDDAEPHTINPITGHPGMQVTEVLEIEAIRSMQGPTRAGKGGTAYQDSLLRDRNRLIADMFTKRCAKGLTTHQAVASICKRMLIGPSTVTVAMAEEGYTFDPPKARSKPKFSTSYDHHYKNTRLKKMVMMFRTNIGPVHKVGSFEINDLLTSGPGGYPTHCPVTGVELDWGVDSSIRSVRIIKINPTEKVSGKNVLIASHIGRYLLSDTRSPKSIAYMLRSVPDADDILRNTKNWIDLHPGNEMGATTVRCVEHELRNGS
jgi:hypothetical protein